MSRVGKVPIKILSGVKVVLQKDCIHIEGPKGKLSHPLVKGVLIKIEDGFIQLNPDSAFADTAPALHGLTRTLIHNMVHGVHTGFTKELDIVGVGYRASVKGSTLTLILGYSHPVDFNLPVGITAKVENNTHIVLTGADKILIGMTAAKIRSFKPPEPYQGKGIKYMNENIIRKQGKAAGAK